KRRSGNRAATLLILSRDDQFNRAGLLQAYRAFEQAISFCAALTQRAQVMGFRVIVITVEAPDHTLACGVSGMRDRSYGHGHASLWLAVQGQRHGAYGGFLTSL